MSEAWAYAGGALLATATLPQAVRLMRTRSAADFGWAFIALNFVGISFLAVRAFDISEWAFFGINVVTASFWGFAAVVKALSRTVAFQAVAAETVAAPATTP